MRPYAATLFASVLFAALLVPARSSAQEAREWNAAAPEERVRLVSSLSGIDPPARAEESEPTILIDAEDKDPIDAAEAAEEFAWDGSPRIIRSVQLRLAQGVDSEGLSALVHLRVGRALERLELRRTVRRLFQTGRFRQVRAHVRQEGGEVHVTLVLLPRQRVAEISFLGARAVDGVRLQRAAGIARGDDLSQQAIDRLTEGVLRTYSRIGYRDAKVATEIRQSDDGQVAVLVRIDEGPLTLMAGLRWEGEIGLEEEVLAEVFGIGAGEPVDLNMIEEALDRVRATYQSQGYLRARVGIPRVESVGAEILDDEQLLPGTTAPGASNGRRVPRVSPRADVVIPVAAGPMVRIVVSGNLRLSEAEIRALLKGDGEGIMDADALTIGARRVERAYRLAGHHHVAVRLHEEDLGDRLHEVAVEIIEGPPMRVRSINFHGGASLPERWMREQVCLALEATVPEEERRLDPVVVSSLGGRGAYRESSQLQPAGVVDPGPCEIFEEGAYARAVDVILDRFARQGWLSAKLSAPVVSLSPDRRVAQVSLWVEEGVRTFISDVLLEGVEVMDTSALLSVVGLSPGGPLSVAAVDEGRYAVRGLYARNGHPFTAVEPEILFSEDRSAAKVIYRVGEGPRVAVGRIIVRGHHHTPASLVRSQLTFRAGDPWDLERVQASQRRILSLGIYRSASIRLLDPEEPAPVMDVVISVSERRPKAMEMGLGLSTEDGPRLFAEYVDHAFLWNSELHGWAKINYPVFPSGLELRRVLTPGMEWEAQAGLRFPTLLAARTDLVGERANRPTFGLTRAAWSVGTDTRWRDDLTASLGVEMEYVDFERAAPDPHLFHPDRELRRFEEGQTLLASLRPGVVLDLRDRRVSPRSGVLAGAALDWSRDLGIGVPVHFLKATASFSGYVPASRRVTVALSARGGMVIPLSEDNVTIEPKRFFLGGADTLRGFPLDGVLPSDQRSSLHEQVEACQGLLTGLTCTEDALLVSRDARRPASAGGEAFVLFKGELRFPIVGGLQGGIFVDAGNLWRDSSLLDILDMRTTAGGGLRYETPIGPVAVDLGVNLVPDQVLHEMPMAIHFAIGLF